VAKEEFVGNSDTTGSGNGILLCNDNLTLQEAGVYAESIISPLYDSSCYAEPIFDWDCYHGSSPDGGATAVHLTEACAAVQRGGEHIQRGTATFFAGLTGGGLCGSNGGAGIAVEQDSATLRFCVTHVAPSGPADGAGGEGFVRAGDIIIAVDGRRCADGTGLSPAQVADLRRICSKGDGGWLAALQGGEDRAIAAPEALREALSGSPGSWVTISLWRPATATSGDEEGRRGGEAVTVRLQRQLIGHYAGEYI
jgi:hypothetical protein